MSFEQYYSTPVTGYLLSVLLWAGIMTVASVITVLVIMRWTREFERSVLVIGIITGLCLGIGGGAMFTSLGDFERNASILQSNIEKKYDVQAVTFNFSTTKAGGYNWTPTQSEPQQVIVKVNGVSHKATLTQDHQTAEPTLIEANTNKELALHTKASQ